MTDKRTDTLAKVEKVKELLKNNSELSQTKACAEAGISLTTFKYHTTKKTKEIKSLKPEEITSSTSTAEEPEVTFALIKCKLSVAATLLGGF